MGVGESLCREPRARAPATMRLTTIFDVAEFSSKWDSFDPTAFARRPSGRLLRFVELSRVDDGAGGRMCWLPASRTDSRI
jgi:hypothetical protein